MKNIIYSKYSNERAQNFKIRTDIIKKLDGSKIVEKKALTKESETHLNNIYRYHDLLADVFKDSDLCINKCVRNDVGIEFEYIEGITLEEELDDLLLKKDYVKLVERIKEYFSILEVGVQNDFFELSPEFEKVFGKVNLLKSLKSFKVSNIDLIFSNIIVGSKLQVIDYEWTFEFSVPFNFIIYRSINYYIYGSSKRHELIDMGLYKLFNITNEEMVQYDIMEKNFQRYVVGNLLPVRELYGMTTKPNINMQNVIESENIRASKEMIQIFYDYGDGFCEHQSYKVMPSINENHEISFEIPITANVKKIRIDPANYSCLVNIKRILGFSMKYSLLDYITNGIALNSGTILFATNDPQIVIPELAVDIIKLEVKLQVQLLTKEMTIQLCELLKNKDYEISIVKCQIEELTNKINKNCIDMQFQIQMNEKLKSEIIGIRHRLEEKDKYIDEIHNRLEEKDKYIDEIHNSKSWKAIEKIKRMVKRIN
ncbi:hypothetical protein ACQPUR_11340 [Clostridium neonatale]|uniref:hypothetical protein n=1 Tax=Clostridium neonatale TaxID=137838 RepID=UPI003D3324C1